MKVLKKIKGREYAVAFAKRKGSSTDIKELRFNLIPNNNLKYWVADPFPIEVDDELYIFGEIFEYAKLKGAIGYTKLEGDSFTPWEVVIDEPYHLSFPNLFYKDGTLYICPEANESRELYLYRCVHFPEVWVKDTVLAEDVNYSDTVFYSNDSGEYGFTCIWDSLEKHEMKMLSCNGGAIKESEGNMKTLEFYLTRPAGKIFFDEALKKDVMVSQICKPKYGSGLILKEFEIDWPDYSEKELCRIYPQDVTCEKKKKYCGMHTLNFTDHYVVIDLVWERFSVVEKWYRGKRKIKKILYNRHI